RGQRDRPLDRFARSGRHRSIDAIPALVVEKLGMARESVVIDLDDAYLAAEDEQLVIRRRRAPGILQHLLGVERAADVLVGPLAAYQREIRFEPGPAEPDEVASAHRRLVLHEAVPAAAMVGLQNEFLWQRLVREILGSIRPPVQRRQEKHGRGSPDIVPHAQLVREESQIRTTVVEDLEDDLFVEAARLIEVRQATKLGSVEACEIITIADKALG